jgi:putative PIN family toxin of toxin-antitoxin system
MTRVVIDTNILVSAAIKEQGAEAGVLALVARGQLLLCVSEPILVEYQGVLLRPKLKLNADSVRRLLSVVQREGSLIKPTVRVAVSVDETDNRFLECAEEAKADFLVTGNRRHFPTHWKKTLVVTARELLELMPPVRRSKDQGRALSRGPRADGE